MLTKENVGKLLEVKKSNFNNAEINILFNHKQFKTLKKLASQLPILGVIDFHTRASRRENRPYIKELMDIQIDDQPTKCQQETQLKQYENNQFSQSANENMAQITCDSQDHFEQLKPIKQDQIGEDMMEQEDFVKNGQIDDLLKDIDERQFMPFHQQSQQSEPFFYLNDIEPIVVANHMTGIFDQEYNFQTLNELKQMLKDWNFFNKYQKYNQAMKQMQRLQMLHDQITEYYEDDEDQTDVFILNFNQHQNYMVPFSHQKLQQISNWNRFLFTAIGINFMYHNPTIIEGLFSLKWENVRSVMLQKITYHSSYKRKNGEVIKVRSPPVNLGMLKLHNLNEQLITLKLSGQRLPTYLAKDFIEINFGRLEQLCLYFRKKIKSSVIKILTCAKFNNLLNPDCQILIHSFKGKLTNIFTKKYFSTVEVKIEKRMKHTGEKGLSSSITLKIESILTKHSIARDTKAHRKKWIWKRQIDSKG